MTALSLNSLSRSLGLSPRRRTAHSAAPTIVAPGLSAVWLFGDGAGQTLTDASGHGHHGQLGSTGGADVNDPSWTAQGLSFDGVDDDVRVPASPSPDTAFHLDVVGQFLSTSPDWAGIFEVSDGDQTTAPIRAGRYAGNPGLWITSGADTATDIVAFTGPPSVFDDGWHLIQVQRGGGSFTIHLDGAAVAPLDVQIVTTSPPTSANFPMTSR